MTPVKPSQIDLINIMRKRVATSQTHNIQFANFEVASLRFISVHYQRLNGGGVAIRRCTAGGRDGYPRGVFPLTLKLISSARHRADATRALRKRGRQHVFLRAIQRRGPFPCCGSSSSRSRFTTDLANRSRASCRNSAALWSDSGIHVVDFPLNLFRTNPYDVISRSRRRPATTVINFHPATGQTTSGKWWTPNPMFTFGYGYGRARLFEFKIQVCRFTRFERRIIDGSLRGAIHNQCHPIIAWRETLQAVTAAYIRFNRREQSASVCRFNPDIRALNRMPPGILDDSLQSGTRGRCTCDKKRDSNKTNPNRFDKHDKKEGGSAANAQYPLGQFRCAHFACYLVLVGRAFGLPVGAASRVEKAFSGAKVVPGNEWSNLWTHRLSGPNAAAAAFSHVVRNGAAGSRIIRATSSTAVSSNTRRT